MADLTQEPLIKLRVNLRLDQKEIEALNAIARLISVSELVELLNKYHGKHNNSGTYRGDEVRDGIDSLFSCIRSKLPSIEERFDDAVKVMEGRVQLRPKK